MEEGGDESRSLGITPTWSVATVLTVLVAVSLIIERSIHKLTEWLRRSRKRPLHEAVEKMKDELMLLGCLSLLLTASQSAISRICIHESSFSDMFYPCQPESIQEPVPEKHSRKLLASLLLTVRPFGRSLSSGNEVENTCPEHHVPFISVEGMEQLHRFLFIMGVTHIVYSCLTMLLSIVKIMTWRKWEKEAHLDNIQVLADFSRELTLKRQSTFVKYHTSSSWSQNKILVWVMCFFRQFGQCVTRADYLSLRFGFVTNHNLNFKYDFHSYMIRTMEDDFKKIVGISAPLWGYVIIFMLANVKGVQLFLWISFIPIILLLLVGAKLQHVIARLALENTGVSGQLGLNVIPRDELFWFNKPELLLFLIHFILFQNAFELASFLWYLLEFGYNSCFLGKHSLVVMRLVLGFAGQFLCSYSTLPLYAIVTQMGTKFKAALISPKLRETLHGWKKDAKRRRRERVGADGSNVRTSDDGTTRTTNQEPGNGSVSDGDINYKAFYSLVHEAEIEMQAQTVAPTDSNDAPLLGNVARSHSLSTLQFEGAGLRNKNYARSFTQPQRNV